MRWEPPSPRVAELIRTGASLLLDAPEEVFAEVDAAVLADPGSAVAADPVLAAAVRRNNHANLIRWAQSNVHEPGAPVRPEVTPETIGVARDLVRRGLDTSALHGYRVGQNVGWQRWMELAFTLTQDPGELHELLAVSARSIFTYVDDMLAELTAQIDRELAELTRGTHAQRLEAVTLLLEGAPIDRHRAVTRLGYELEQGHTAAIVWSDDPATDPALLERAAEAIGQAAGSRPLSVLASASALWVWVAGADGPAPAAIGPALGKLPGVRVALGPSAEGVAGFRRSHLDALATQRLMHRSAQRPALASYDEVQVVALAAQDEERADEFVRRTLGALADASAELRETARTYLREGHNATGTARALFTHRNTVVARLARIDELLPAPLEGRSLPVALALEIVHWRGSA